MTTASVKSPMPFTRATLQDGVYMALKQAIMNGAYLPGQRLTVRELAEQMQTSTMPVREALRRLTAQGALTPLANGAICLPELSRTTLRNITEIRLEVESLAAKKAAENMSDANLDALIELQQRHEKIRDGKAQGSEAASNEAFHFKLYEMANSPELFDIISNLWLRAGPFLRFYMEENIGSEAENSVGDKHRQIIEALKRRDGDAAAAALRADIAMGRRMIETIEFE